MSDLGPLPELAWLPIDKLDINPAYQRTLDTGGGRRVVDKIAAEFDWYKFGTLTATPNPEAEGRWLIIDGQHRTAGARQRGGIPHLPSIVHQGMDVAAQAAAFVGANRDRVTMTAQALFYAKLAARDPEAATIARICLTHGIEILRYHLTAKQIPAHKTAAVPALARILKQHGEQVLDQSVRIVAQAFGRLHGGCRAPFFAAAARCIKGGDSPERIIARMSELGIGKLEAAAVGIGGYEAVTAMVALLKKGQPAQAILPRPILPRPIPPPTPQPPRKPAAARQPVSGFKQGPLPEPPSAARTAHDSRRRDEEEAIQRHLAQKGARLVMGPEQVAQFLRDAGHTVVISEVNENRGEKRHPANRLILGYRPVLDGEPCSMTLIYETANKLRAEAGLGALEIPVEPQRAA